MAVRSRLRALAATGFMLAGVAHETAAQALGIATGRDLPEWLSEWSPLNDVGTLPRRLPTAAPAVPALLYPLEKLGLFWSGGNPAALPWDVDDELNELSIARAAQDGEYRRPMDPAAARVTRLQGMGWQPLGARGAVAGGVLFDRTIRDPSSISNMTEPYASTPFVMTDTSAYALRTSRARLEGAGGWRLGSWGLGLALGYDTRRTTPVAAPFIRLNRAVLPAATVGVVRDLGAGRVQVGFRAGWQGGEETITLARFGATGEMWQLTGYAEVPRVSIGLTPIIRRVSREGVSIGFGAAGSAGDARWNVFAETARREERESTEAFQDPPQDRWDTDGRTFGAALQLPFRGGRGVLTLHGKTRNVRGSAELFPGRTGIASDETETNGSAEVRLRGGSDAWMAIARASVLSERRERSDSAADARSEIEAITPGLALEAGRRISRRVALIGGYAIANYAGSGTIPSAAARGPVFQRAFAPELDIATSDIRAQAFTGALRWQTQPRTSVWVVGRMEWLSPHSADRPFAPSGERRGTNVSVGVAMTPRRQ